MADNDEDDVDFEAMEKELLGDDEDDPFAACELCMDVAELLAKLGSNTEKLVGLYPEVEISDAKCKALAQAIAKASKLEGITFDGAVISSGGLLILIDAVKKHPNMKFLNFSSMEIDDKVVKFLTEYIESNQTLKLLHLMHSEISPAGTAALLKVFERNRYLTDIQVGTMEEDVVAKLEKITARNKANPPPVVQQPKVAASSSSGAVPSSGGGKVITVWYRGEVHIGENPPAEPGWNRLTFDAGTQFGGGSSVNSNPSAVAQQSSQTVSKSSPSSKEVAASSSKATQAPANAASSTSVAAVSKATTRPTAPAAPAPAPAKSQSKVLFRVKAVFDYLEPGDEEVAFKTGDQIDILKIVDEDWYIGKVERTGQTGQVPENHTKKI